METTTRITGDELIALGFKPGRAIGAAIKINKKRNGYKRAEMITRYAEVLANPEQFLQDKIFQQLATVLIEERDAPKHDLIALAQVGKPYQLYGADHIEDGARRQMEIAMQLPVTVAGALMPDAHQGYGLPIGGVLATRNAVIPYGVGVDIGCRMALSVFDVPEAYFLANRDLFQNYILSQTRFGAGHGFTGQQKSDHEVLTSEAFDAIPFVGALRDKAWTQLGSSGGGNHFVEFGIIDFASDDQPLGVKAGKYLALLTHSGSRGMGATIAGHYTKLAKEICKLPYEAANLAYLDLDSAEGQEYWMAMNLAGDYASACHEVIHEKLAALVGGTRLARIENHHNFAWKEIWNGEEVIVHRKGATPAGKGVMGIIPGSMTAPGFLVRGKGEENAINSASHGAGRQMSRTAAIKNISLGEFASELAKHDVRLIGAGLDEAPMAYKDIGKVMAAQTDLVEVVAKFSPKIVRMADDGSRED